MTQISEKTKPRILHSNKSRKHATSKVVVGPAPLKPPHHQSTAPAQQANTEPVKARLVRSVEGVDSIEVTCACGETIIVQCDYS